VRSRKCYSLNLSTGDIGDRASVHSSVSLMKRTFSGLKWAYTSTFLQAILQLVVISVLAHLLSPTDFGLLGIALIFTGLAELISQLGIGPAIIQRKELTYSHIRVGFTLTILFGIGFFCLLWFSAPIAARFFKNEDVINVLRGVSIVFVIGSFGVVAEALLRRYLRFKELMIAEVVSYAIGYGLVGISMALMGKGVWALVGAVVFQRIFYVIIVLLCSPHSFLLLFSRSELRDLLSFGGGFTLARIFNFTALQGDNFVVGRFLGADALGLYSRAYQLMTLPATYFAQVLDKVLFPAMAEIQTETERLRRVYLRVVEITSMIALPTSGLMFLAAPEIIGTLFGPKWSDAVPVLQILALGVLFRTGYKISDSLARALGAIYRRAWRQGIYATLVVLGTILGTAWGLSGVAAAVVISVFINYLFMSHLSLKLLQVPCTMFVRSHLPAVWVSGCVTVMTWISLNLLRSFEAPEWYILAGSVAGGFIWIILSFIVLPKKILGSGIEWVLSNIDAKRFGLVAPILMWIYRRFSVANMKVNKH
jgi:O-antigen/teichoic acid export membrane protein